MRKSMEAKLSTKKRKQVHTSASNPFKGVFTRSKSQIYIHHTRSGKTRYDVSRRVKGELPYVRSNEFEALDVENLGNICIKDLRARRVFSPVCNLIENESDYKCQIRNDGCPNLEDNSVKLTSPDDEIGGNGGKECGRIDCKGQIQNDVSPNLYDSMNLADNGVKLVGLSEDCVQLTPPDDEIGGNGGKEFLRIDCKGQIQNDVSPNLYDSVNLADNSVKLDMEDLKLSEDCAQLTPPDDEIGGNGCGRIDVSPNLYDSVNLADNSVKLDMEDLKLSEDCVQLTPPDDEIGGNGSKECAKMEFDCSNVLVSRSKRVKLFKTPSSFSYRRLLPYLMDISKDDSCMQKIEIVDLQFPCKVQKLDHMNPNFSPMPDSKPSVNDGRSVEDVVEIIYDDSHQSTPPDSIIFAKPDELDNILQNDEFIPDESLNGAVSDQTKGLILNENSNDDIMPDESTNRAVSDQTKGLLPNDNQNDEIMPDESLNRAVSDQTKGLIPNEKSNDDIMPDESLSGAVSDQRKGLISDDKQDDEIIPFEPLNGDQTKRLIANHKPVLRSCSRVEAFKIPGSVSHRRLLPSLMEVANDNPGLSRVSQEPDHAMETDPNVITSKDQDDILRTEESKLSTNLAKVSSEVLQISTNCGEVSPRPVANLDIIPSKPELDVSIDPKGIMIDPVEDLVKESPCPNSSPCLQFDTLETNISDMRKGILRRNPRGCRGICNCLNCASFRLHAGKAFEFSQNQMRDFEEIASELVNELSYMRNLLKETGTKPRVIKSNQVKEACSKSLKTEELIKRRLGEMNEDLKFHCRNTCLQKSSVTFSANNTEKLIPKIIAKK